MQSIELKRFPIHRIAAGIVAVGTLTIVLTATGTLFDASDDDDNARTTVRTVQRAAPAYSAQFLEWNTSLPEAGTDSPQPSVAPKRASHPTAQSSDLTRFLEMNVFMPGMTIPTVQSYEQARFLEMNMLPDHQSTYLPSPDDLPHDRAQQDY